MFLVEYATELMQLALGAGFLLLVIFVARPLMVAYRLLRDIEKVIRKIEDLTELFDEYIRKPAQVASQVLSFVTPLLVNKLKK